MFPEMSFHILLYWYHGITHQFDGAEQLTLQIITIVGCTLSIIGLLATIIGLAVFKLVSTIFHIIPCSEWYFWFFVYESVNVFNKIIKTYRWQFINEYFWLQHYHEMRFRQIRSVLTNRVHIGLSTSLLFAYIFLLIGPDLVEEEGVSW